MKELQDIYDRVLNTVAYQLWTPEQAGCTLVETLALIGANWAGVDRILSDGTVQYRLFFL